jgi:hypothetical protein
LLPLVLRGHRAAVATRPKRKQSPGKRVRQATKSAGRGTAADPYLDSLRPIWSTLVKGRREFADRGPLVLLYDVEEGRVYVYPLGPFKSDLSPASQASLDEQWRQAERKGQTVVFVRDNTARKLVSYSLDVE